MFKNVTIIDSVGQTFFARQLEHIKAQSYDVVYQDLIARQLFPVSNEAPEGVDTITYRTYEKTGMARIINGNAQDLPRADLFGKETTIPVRALGISFGYTRDEILKAKLTGVPLDQRRADAAMRGFEQKIDIIGWNGSAEDGLIGFLTHPNIPDFTPPTGLWMTATPDEIIADLNEAVGEIRETTRLKEKPNTLLVPVRVYNRLNGTPRSTYSDTTIMQFVLKNVEGIDTIIPVNELTTTARLYDRNPGKLQMEIVKELTFLPPQEKGLELLIPAWGKTGGVNVYYPMSILNILNVNT